MNLDVKLKLLINKLRSRNFTDDFEEKDEPTFGKYQYGKYAKNRKLS